MTTSLHEPAAAEVGRLLREARLACGKELAVAAEELRIRPTHLEALEEGRRAGCSPPSTWSARRAPTPSTSASTAPSSRGG